MIGLKVPQRSKVFLYGHGRVPQSEANVLDGTF